MVVDSSETQAGGRTSEDVLEGGPFRALQTERIACKCPEARRKVADKRTERRQWGWDGVEAEGEMDHRRLEESPPILGPPLPKGPGPWGLGCHMEMRVPVSLLTLGYVESIIVKEGAYIWQDIDGHLNAATLEALIFTQEGYCED